MDARDIGDLSVTGSTISAPSDADLTLTTSGAGSVSVDGIQIKGTELSSTDSSQVTIKENLHVTGNITGTIDADNSTISNLEVDNFKASAIVTEAEGIGSNDNDTTIPTSAAVKDYVDARDIGDLSVTGSTISAPSNAALTLTTSGSGTIELQTDTNLTGTLSVTGNIAKTGDLIVDVSSSIILDADSGTVFVRDGSAGNYGQFIRNGSNDLTIASGATQAVIFTGANAAFQGTLSASGTISNSQISMEGNRIKTTASNADLQLETAGTGLIDLETPTQMTVGAVGAATHLPLDSANEIRPVGYLRIKISCTEYVIPYFNAS